MIRVGGRKLVPFMAEEIPLFDGYNMHVHDWIGCFFRVLGRKEIFDCVPRLMEISRHMRGEAYKWFIESDVLGKTVRGDYNSNEFCYDLFFRFCPDEDEEIQKCEEQPFKETPKSDDLRDQVDGADVALQVFDGMSLRDENEKVALKHEDETLQVIREMAQRVESDIVTLKSCIEAMKTRDRGEGKLHRAMEAYVLGVGTEAKSVLKIFDEMPERDSSAKFEKLHKIECDGSTGGGGDVSRTGENTSDVVYESDEIIRTSGCPSSCNNAAKGPGKSVVEDGDMVKIAMEAAEQAVSSMKMKTEVGSHVYEGKHGCPTSLLGRKSGFPTACDNSATKGPVKSVVEDGNMFKIAMEAAERAISSMKMKTEVGSHVYEVQEKEGELAQITSSETDLNDVLGAWYSAGFYTGKYVVEQSIARKLRS